MSKKAIYVLIVVLIFLIGHIVFIYNRATSKMIVSETGVVNLSKKTIETNQDKNDEKITLLFVGDIMLSRTIGKLMENNNDWRYPFLMTADFLKKADLTFGNLEGPISSRGTKVGSIYSFRADPRSIEGLLYAGFDVLSLANNHIWDYGREAFDDTLSILKNNNIGFVGAGSSFEESHTPLIKEVRGTKIAYLGYTNLLPSFLLRNESVPSIASIDKEQIIKDIKRAKESSDLVIVSFHFGDEYQIIHNTFQEDLAHTTIDAGADLVVGHHPHVIQDIEEYKGSYIIYSLGNFVFDQNFSEDTKTGLLITASVENKKITEIKQYKIKFTDTFQPYIESGGAL